MKPNSKQKLCFDGIYQQLVIFITDDMLPVR
jgi:hypothetical protein